ncbi:glutaredoxin-2 [Pelagophyceae sp. CCMP2097]|nr:glutaredoxin-2 [Pelagophyceae sp. CCMP2097]
MGASHGIKDPEAFVTEELAKGKVTIFSKSYCPSCAATKQLLASLGVEANILELDTLGEPRNGPVQQALEKITGTISTPQVFGSNGKFVGGNDALQKLHGEGKLAALLK